MIDDDDNDDDDGNYDDDDDDKKKNHIIIIQYTTADCPYIYTTKICLETGNNDLQHDIQTCRRMKCFDNTYQNMYML